MQFTDEKIQAFRKQLSKVESEGSFLSISKGWSLEESYRVLHKMWNVDKIGYKIGAVGKVLEGKPDPQTPLYGILKRHMGQPQIFAYKTPNQTHPGTKIELEIAVVFGRDVSYDFSMTELMSSLSWVVPAFEIVGGRLESPWEASASQLVLDNMLCDDFVLSDTPLRFPQDINIYVDNQYNNFLLSNFTLYKNGEEVSQGKVYDHRIGHPFSRLYWLGKQLVRNKQTPFRAGEVVITGSILTPAMYDVSPGDAYKATFHTDNGTILHTIKTAFAT